jgi:hypothetical protein
VLSIDGNRLNGTLPFAIGELTNLEHLNLGKFSLLGIFFQFSEEMQNRLSVFCLALTTRRPLNHRFGFDTDVIGLTGTIPIEIGNLKRLTNLNLGE